MRYNFTYDSKSLYKIENLLPRLKYSKFPTHIIRWLENFEEDDVEHILTLLLNFEYIPYNELLMRLDDLLYEFLKDIKVDEGVVFIPFGKIGKSSTLITYPLKHSNAFKSRNNFLIQFDYENIKNTNQYKHIVFIDDFIGSGHSFCKVYSSENVKKWISENNFESVNLLAVVTMFNAKKYLKDRFPDLNIISEYRSAIFCKEKSPLRFFGNLDETKRIIEKYKYFKYAPLGYSDTEAFISFFYGTPNNTLPIVWANTEKWKFLFPRIDNSKISEIRDLKKEYAFFIGVYNRLGLDILKINNTYEYSDHRPKKRTFAYNTKEHHSIIAILFLKKKENLEDMVLCQLLGLTNKELKDIYTLGVRLQIFTKNREITLLGMSLINNINAVVRTENFRKESPMNMLPKNKVYLPKQFGGKT
ncbi:hypothetical protein [Chryseobacterium rhizosphaerae]|uniref:phosphoribosyltransferase-like protein n=1 Tax=Chryseobacterium rhizosphaerae TaxID=395937 RepID=UPI00235A365F|nr:hypothetical protein [Chryseobacterium rhizosphaerae]MDC8099569.1 hypothetical protein [Chryseobacterium rhizosphaerae]